MARKSDRSTRDGDRPSRTSGSGTTFTVGDDDEAEFTVDPVKQEAVQKLREHLDKDTFLAALDDYRKLYGLPDPFDLLQIVFERHPDAKVRAEALEKMDAAIDRQAEPTKQVFKTRVKLLQLTAREPEIKRLAVKIARARNY